MKTDTVFHLEEDGTGIGNLTGPHTAETGGLTSLRVGSELSDVLEVLFKGTFW